MMGPRTQGQKVQGPNSVPERTDNLRSSFSFNLLTILGGQAACAMLGIGIEVFYARVLGATGRGQIGLCLMAVAACVLFGGLGVEYPALLWAAERRHRHAEWLPGVFWAGATGSTVAIALWAFFYWRLQPSFLQGITPVMAWLVMATIPCGIFFGYLMAIVAGQERFGLRAGVALAEQAASVVALVLLVLIFGRKAGTAVAANLCAILLGAGICLFALRDHWNVSSLSTSALNEMRTALGLGLPAIMGNVANFFNYRLDVFVVNYFLNPAAVGVYSLGVVVSEGLWQIPRATALALFPRTARTSSEEATEFTCLIIRQVFLIASVMGAVVAVASPLLVPLVFGKHFADSVAVIWWILPGTVTLAVAKIMCADLAGRKKGYYASFFALFTFLLTIGLDFTLIPKLGINGAAMASSISYILNSILIAVVLRRELKVSWRTLFVPRRSEWVAYLSLWYRYRARLRTPEVAVAEPSPRVSLSETRS
jgi:O-antigen/teichoic acid export membrane protein